MRQLI